MVVVGVDIHKRTPMFVIVDQVGRELGHRTCPATTAGQEQAVRWSGNSSVPRRCAHSWAPKSRGARRGMILTVHRELPGLVRTEPSLH